MSFHDSEGLPSTDVPDQPQDSGFHDPAEYARGAPRTAVSRCDI